MGFVVCVVRTCEGVPGKDKLKVVTVDIGSEVLTIVTNAPNIREGTRTCVATIGTEFDADGEVQTIKKTNIGGRLSEGMICDSVMLGWAGGAAGIAVQVPDSLELGSPAPASKPRLDSGSSGSVSAPVEKVPELDPKAAKAAEKAARRAQLLEKRTSKKAAKTSTVAGSSTDETEGEGGEHEKEERDETIDELAQEVEGKLSS